MRTHHVVQDDAVVVDEQILLHWASGIRLGADRDIPESFAVAIRTPKRVVLVIAGEVVLRIDGAVRIFQAIVHVIGLILQLLELLHMVRARHRSLTVCVIGIRQLIHIDAVNRTELADRIDLARIVARYDIGVKAAVALRHAVMVLDRERALIVDVSDVCLVLVVRINLHLAG